MQYIAMHMHSKAQYGFYKSTHIYVCVYKDI